MEFTDTALILKVGRFREADLWLKLLTPTRGVMTAFAFGGSVSRRRFCGCLDPLNIILGGFRSSRRDEYIQLSEARLTESFPRLRSDQSRMGLAANCLKFMEAVQAGPEGAAEAYELTVRALRVLGGEEEIPDAFPLFFRIHVTFAQGFSPDLNACHVCGQTINDTVSAHFILDRARLACASCGPGPGMAMPVSPGTLRTLAYLAANGPEGWRKLTLPKGVREECYAFIDGFVGYHLGLRWERGRFVST